MKSLAQTSANAATCFKPEFDCMADSELLHHFVTRQKPRYFPVIDREHCRRKKMDAMLTNSFEFNNETHGLAAPLDWLTNPSDDIEWHILLHKFYYATGLGLAFSASKELKYLHKWLELTDSWMAQTPPGFIAADVTGRRIQNWIYAYYFFVERQPQCLVPASFLRTFLQSLYEQLAYLVDHLAPARNHRTLQLQAIFLAAVVFPELQDAQRWRRFSQTELEENLRVDFLDDGVHCELSTDYHHLALKNLLNFRRLALLNDIPVAAETDERLRKALRFSLHAHKPDGVVPAFSDGDARSHASVLRSGYAIYQDDSLLFAATRGNAGQPPAETAAAFPDSGYYAMRSRWGDKSAHYLLCDCGPLGQGNHGHLDALSIEVAAFGRSLIVDPGRYTYYEGGSANWRARFRGTAAHNTVLVDGKNQTRYAPVFGKKRWWVSGDPPETRCHGFRQGGDTVYFHGSTRSHEYNALHERRIIFVGGVYWIIIDTLSSPSEHRYELLLHLSESAQNNVQQTLSANTVNFVAPNLVLGHFNSEPAEYRIRQGHIAYQYGKKLSAPVISATSHTRTCEFVTVVYPYQHAAPTLEIQASAPSNTPQLVKTCQIRIKRGLHVTTDSCWLPVAAEMEPERPGELDLLTQSKT